MDDLLQLTSLLKEEEILIQESVARFIHDKALPLLPDAFEKGIFPTHLIQDLCALGVLGLTLPQAYGGAEASYFSYGLVCQELEKGDSGLRSFVSVQNSLCIEPIFQFGSETQKKMYLPLMAQGKIIGCFGLTEPDSGSYPAGMKTFAKKVRGGYQLNGNKMWITNASIADLAIVWANTEMGIRGFIVPKETKGFRQHPIHHKMSLRASVTGELVFDHVFVSEEQYLPGTEIGLKAALHCLNQARFGIAWGVLGAACACFDTTRHYLLERKQATHPLASFQMIQSELATMYSDILYAQCLNYRITQLKVNHQATPTMISLAKRQACRVALSVARTCRQLLGANGISLEYPIIRHMLNLESVITYEGTDHIHTLILGRHITQHDAFRKDT